MSDRKPVLFGAVIDVSGLMGHQFGHNNSDEVGSWMRTVLELIDQIIVNDVSNDNKVLLSAFGAAHGNPVSVFDILQTFQKVQYERNNIKELQRKVHDPYPLILEM